MKFRIAAALAALFVAGTCQAQCLNGTQGAWQRPLPSIVARHYLAASFDPTEATGRGTAVLALLVLVRASADMQPKFFEIAAAHPGAPGCARTGNG